MMQIQKTHIKTFDELLTYFEMVEVTKQDVEQISNEVLNVINLDEELSKHELIEKLKEWWKNPVGLRPIFLGIDLDVIK